MALSGSVTGLLVLTLVLGMRASPNQRDLEYYDDQAEDYNYGDYEEGVQDDVDFQSREQNSIAAVRPEIISQPEHLVVDNGMTISLPCVVDKLPAGVQIMWQKLDSKKTIIAVGSKVIDHPQLTGRAFVTVTDKGSTLAIGAANTEDAGQYKCEVAVQNNSPALQHTVSIRAPPSISSSSPASITVEKGQDVTLSCRGKGSPEPRIVWTRVGSKMPNGQETLESDVVTFSRVSRKHAGIYKCTASNGHGSGATKQMEVLVRYLPEVEVSEVFVHKMTDDEAELVCSVHAFPAATVTWTKGGSAVTESDTISISHRGGRHALIFKKVSRSDFGDYSCHASNEVGDVRDTRIQLSGHAMPADFKSSPSGLEANSFLIEWSSFSFSPIQEFILETSTSPSGPWVARGPTRPTKEAGPFLWAGKFYLTGLEPATQYRARVTAKNGEGWGKPGTLWNFATMGAEVLAEPSVRAGSDRNLGPGLLLTAVLVILSLERGVRTGLPC